MFPLSSWYSISGQNGFAVSDRSTVRSSKNIAVTENVLIGCLCILLSTALLICSTELLLYYADKDTQMIFKRVDSPLNNAVIRSCKSVITQENTVNSVTTTRVTMTKCELLIRVAQQGLYG